MASPGWCVLLFGLLGVLWRGLLQVARLGCSRKGYGSLGGGHRCVVGCGVLGLGFVGGGVVGRVVCVGGGVAPGLGSTAYSFSAGGVPCHPAGRAVQVTPIAPHAPRLSPVLLPHGVVVELDALALDRRPVRAVADGIELGPVAQLRVSAAEDDVRLAFFAGHTFTRSMLRKVLRR